MKKTKKISLLLLTIFIVTTPVLAADGESTIEIPNPIEQKDLLALIETVVNYLLWIAIVMAPLVIIIAAFMFLTAGGNEKRVGTARKMFLWAIVGITVALISKGIVTLIKDFLNSTT
jgi:hypothetical protein